jgi:hypothetical protein
MSVLAKSSPRNHGKMQNIGRTPAHHTAHPFLDFLFCKAIVRVSARLARNDEFVAFEVENHPSTRERIISAALGGCNRLRSRARWQVVQ